MTANGQFNANLVSRSELVEMARMAGLDVSERTIRYWATIGLLPHPEHVPGHGRRAFYPVSLLDELRRLCELRKLRSLRVRAEQLQVLVLGGQPFVVAKPLAVSQRGNFTYSLYELADGGLVLNIRPSAREPRLPKEDIG